MSYLLILITEQTLDSYSALSRQQQQQGVELDPASDILDLGSSVSASYLDVPMTVGGYVLTGKSKAKKSSTKSYGQRLRK